ncbi:Icc-related predicted phosphoesterase [Hasllibacter halocynthiae]|uniref:Icc-related predicted phosphoesterase n=1 Tax=Hasllibacter halocynthiae TaxID=595589 RepID=A0A2T0X3S4_9RHOB|nr:metallophosphoesterase [Hasllibacter halocynthiae]PRY93606.1 Icc-related predicted phosphoesterase [Hasllibacter halocynthiae]
MKVVAVSDLHLDPVCLEALLLAAEGADLVLNAGDLARRHEGLGAYAAGLAPLEGRLVSVPGNNETLGAARAALPGTVLHGEAVEVAGLVVAGLGGGVPPLQGAPFPSWDLSEEEAETLLAPLEGADILLTHSPPLGVGDRLSGRSAGSSAIRGAVQRMAPSLHLFGHVHSSWGARGRIGETLCANLGPVPVLFEVP